MVGMEEEKIENAQQVRIPGGWGRREWPCECVGGGLQGYNLLASGDGDLIALEFAMVGMEEKNIENAQKVIIPWG